METSESEAPEANKLAWKGLRSKEFTEPVCLLLLKIKKIGIKNDFKNSILNFLCDLSQPEHGLISPK